MKLSGVMLNSADPKKLAEFYTKLLGKPDWEQEGMYGYGGTGNGILIMGHSEVKGKNTMPARIMISFTTGDVKKDFAAMKAAGAKVVAEPYQPQADKMPDTWLATVADPDGNYLQLSTPWK